MFPFRSAIILLTFLSTSGSCATGEDAKPKPVPPTKAEDCDRAYQRLKSLGCEEAEPTPNGKTFLDWCNEFRVTAAGIDPVCMSRVRDCDQVNQCGR